MINCWRGVQQPRDRMAGGNTRLQDGLTLHPVFPASPTTLFLALSAPSSLHLCLIYPLLTPLPPSSPSSSLLLNPFLHVSLSDLCVFAPGERPASVRLGAGTRLHICVLLIKIKIKRPEADEQQRKPAVHQRHDHYVFMFSFRWSEPSFLAASRRESQ